MSRKTDRLARRAGLPPARTAFSVDHTLRVPMSDGTELAASRWIPSSGDASPLLIMRSPYGRREQPNEIAIFAERGYQVLVVSVRGTFGSGGTFEPFGREYADGMDTLSWTERQQWFPGRAAMIGASYIGHTQWAIAAKPPDWLRCHCMAVTTRDVRQVVYPRGLFNLDTALTWLYALEYQERSRAERLYRVFVARRRATARAARRLPVSEADLPLVGHVLRPLRQWTEQEDETHPWWQALAGYAADYAATRPVTTSLGWYDLFIESSMRDVEELRAAGAEVRAVVGAWHHFSREMFFVTLKAWWDQLERHLRPEDPPAPEPVAAPLRVQVMGSGEWLDLASWPPPSRGLRLYPAADRFLAEEAARDAATSTYTFRPGNPTPAVGGCTLNPSVLGPRDQSRRERRDDVLVWTGPPRSAPLTIAGDAVVELRVRPSHEHVDYVVRLCDVSPRGRSVNITDGAVRLRPGVAGPGPDGFRAIRIPLAPTAHCFLPGHRIRLQVSSGAHPVVAVNTGSGEPLATAARLVDSVHEVRTGGADGTWLELPVLR